MNERRKIASVKRVFAEDLVCVYQNSSLLSWFLKDEVLLLIKPFFVLKGWQNEKCVYWKVPLGLKWVCESRILRVERRGPLNIYVSRKTACSGDISQVNLIVGWNQLAKSTKIEISSTGMFHKKDMSSVNLFQTSGSSGLAAKSHFQGPPWK